MSNRMKGAGLQKGDSAKENEKPTEPVVVGSDIICRNSGPRLNDKGEKIITNSNGINQSPEHAFDQRYKTK